MIRQIAQNYNRNESKSKNIDNYWFIDEFVNEYHLKDEDIIKNIVIERSWIMKEQHWNNIISTSRSVREYQHERASENCRGS